MQRSTAIPTYWSLSPARIFAETEPNNLLSEGGEISHITSMAAHHDNDDGATKGESITCVESSIIPGTCVSVCGPLDILAGRTRKKIKEDILGKDHLGTRLFKEAIVSKLQAYQDDRRKSRSQLIKNIVSELLAHGCRFLKYDENTDMFVVLDQKQIRDKVSFALRHQNNKHSSAMSTRKNKDKASPSEGLSFNQTQSPEGNVKRDDSLLRISSSSTLQDEEQQDRRGEDASGSSSPLLFPEEPFQCYSSPHSTLPDGGDFLVPEQGQEDPSVCSSPLPFQCRDPSLDSTLLLNGGDFIPVQKAPSVVSESSLPDEDEFDNFLSEVLDIDLSQTEDQGGQPTFD